MLLFGSVLETLFFPWLSVCLSSVSLSVTNRVRAINQNFFEIFKRNLVKI